MDTLRQDIRYGWRMLLKNPWYTAVAVITLALGIGANTAIFSLVEGVLLKSLPFTDPDRLVVLQESWPKEGVTFDFSAPDFEFFRREAKSFEAIAGYQNLDYELSGSGESQKIVGSRATANLFSVLGVAPAVGRSFTEEEDRNNIPVTVLSYGLWQKKFGGDQAIIGKAVNVNRRAYTVVGVMPKSFHFPLRGPETNGEPADLYIPMAFTPQELSGFANMYNSTAIARLRPGVTLEQARAEARTLIKQFESQYPAAVRSMPSFALEVPVEPYRNQVVGHVRLLLLVLQAAVAVLLLIGCVNVANFALTRATARRREMAIRAALGAGNLQLVRLVLMESVMLALIGGALGLTLAWWTKDLLLAATPLSIPQMRTIGIDWGTLGFTLAVSIVTAVLFGLAPAWRIGRENVIEDLQGGSRGASVGRGRHRLLGGLVSAQFGLAVVLLVCAGLLLRSFVRLMNTDPGFQTEHLITFRTSLPANAYLTADQIRGFFNKATEQVSGLPGVRSVGAGTSQPLMVEEHRMIYAEGASAPGAENHIIEQQWTLANYFSTLGISLKAGRYFTAADQDSKAPPVVIVNQAFARQYWPGQDALGRRVKWGSANSKGQWMTVVGVVGDVKNDALNKNVVAQTYTPYMNEREENIQESITGELRSLAFFVRGTEDPTTLISEATRVVHQLDPALAVVEAKTLESQLHDAVKPQRFNTELLGAFGGLALLLAIAGIWGVLAYTVSQRTHEIGVRMALGARREDVVRLVLGEGMSLVAFGIAIGTVVALGATRLIASLLFGIGPRDPWTFAGVAAVLLGAAVMASYIPARRAAKVDPMVALRYE